MKHDFGINMIRMAAALMVMTAASASAISTHYREQLERSGCTQQNAGNICDIHKPKARNAAAIKTSQYSAAAERRQIATFLHDSVRGKGSKAAAEALKRYGFTETDPGIWLKNGDSDSFVVDVLTQDGRIKSAKLK